MFDDTTTREVELSRGEARTIISGLAEFETTKTGREDESVLALQERFKEEFDFDEERYDEDDGELL
jgi:hypothetical protein